MTTHVTFYDEKDAEYVLPLAWIGLLYLPKYEEPVVGGTRHSRQKWLVLYDEHEIEVTRDTYNQLAFQILQTTGTSA